MQLHYFKNQREQLNDSGFNKRRFSIRKRVSITPETAKNLIGLGLKVYIEKDYANHLGIDDNNYKDVGVEIKSSAKEVSKSSDLITKVNCPSENEINILEEKHNISWNDEPVQKIKIKFIKSLIKKLNFFT